MSLQIFTQTQVVGAFPETSTFGIETRKTLSGTEKMSQHFCDDSASAKNPFGHYLSNTEVPNAVSTSVVSITEELFGEFSLMRSSKHWNKLVEQFGELFEMVALQKSSDVGSRFSILARRSFSLFFCEFVSFFHFKVNISSFQSL